MSTKSSVEDMNYIFHLGNAGHYLFHLMVQSAESSHQFALLSILKAVIERPETISMYEKNTLQVIVNQVEQVPSRFKYVLPVFRREIQAAIKDHFKI